MLMRGCVCSLRSRTRGHFQLEETDRKIYRENVLTSRQVRRMIDSTYQQRKGTPTMYTYRRLADGNWYIITSPNGTDHYVGLSHGMSIDRIVADLNGAPTWDSVGPCPEMVGR